jgi:PKD repeat protein
MKIKLLLLGILCSASILRAQVQLSIESPEHLIQSFSFSGLGAEWSSPDMSDPANAILGSIEFVEDGTEGINGLGNPFSQEGCNPLMNDLTGKIALIYRGSCNFSLKALNAQNAGAIGFIVINSLEETFEMGAGDFADQVVIPGAMITLSDGNYLRDQMLLGENVQLFYGSKQGFYQNDAAIYFDEALISKFGTYPKSLADNQSFSITPGANIHNFGFSNNEFLLSATVNGPDGVLYYDISQAVFIVAGQAVFVNLTDVFTADWTPGTYTLSYNVSVVGHEDDNPENNTLSYEFVISDNIISLARQNGNGTSLMVNSYPRISSSSYTSCLLLRENIAEPHEAKGIHVTSSTLGNGSIEGSWLIAEFYEWMDGFNLSEGLSFITEGDYTYPSNLDGQQVYIPFAMPVELESNKRYLACVSTYNPNIAFGYDNNINYWYNVNTLEELVNPINLDGVWYTGWSGQTALALGLEVQPKDDVVDGTISFVADPISGCTPLTVSFTYTGDHPNAHQYYWFFGNGDDAFTENPNVSYTFNAQSNYEVILYVYDQFFNFIGSSHEYINVTGNYISASNTFPSIGEDVNFFVGGNFNSVSWNFGDGSSSMLNSPNYSYNEIGTYVVTATVNSTECGIRDYQLVINVNDISASATPNSGCAPLDVTLSFTGNAPNAFYYYWYSFDNLNIETTESSIQHTFNNPGFNSIELWLFDENYNFIGATSTSVNVESSSVFVSNTTLAAGASTYFEIQGGYNSVTWNLGDGTIEQSGSFMYAYNEPGTYTVTVNVDSDCGSYQETITIQVLDLSVSASTTQGCAPLSVDFTYTGAVPVTYFNWNASNWTGDFGENSTFSTTFTEVGNQNVEVYFYDENFNYLGMNRIDILVQGANIWASTIMTSVDSPVFFEVEGFYSSVTWNFGDGNSSTNPSSVHTYSAAGIYDVVASIQTEGCGLIQETITITVKDYSLTVTPNSGCGSFEATLTFSGNDPEIVYYYWQLPDGSDEWTETSTYNFTFTNNGQNYVNLLLFDANYVFLGMASSFVTVEDYEIGGFENVGVGSNTYFWVNNDPLSISWNFGDGNFSNEPYPEHVYNDVGTYTVTAIIQTANCGVIEQTLTVNVINVQIEHELLTNCAPAEVQFSFVGDIADATYFYWEFDQLGQSCCNEENPTFTFEENGSYEITLFVLDNEWDLITVVQKIIHIGAGAQISNNMTNVNESFNYFTTGDAVSVEWNFGDGTTSNNLSGSHSYSANGEYTVTATLFSETCGETELTFNVLVTDISFTASVLSGCSPLTVDFEYTGNQPNAVNFSWQFGNGQNVCCDNLNPTVTYTNGGNYFATLTVFDDEFEFIGMYQIPIVVSSGGLIVPSIPTANGVCNVTVTTVPVATTCSGVAVSGTTTDPLTYTGAGTYQIGWLFDDGQGNTATRTQLVVISSPATGHETVTACESFVWATSGETYATSGDYPFTITSVGGCDSLAVLHLTILENTTGSETVEICESFTWSADGITYTTSGIYTAILENAAGCDSVVTLNLTIKEASFVTQSATACNSYTWEVDGNTYTTSGSYDAVFVNAVGCDSIVTLNVTIEQITNNTLSMTDNVITANSTSGSYQWVNCETNEPITGATNQTFAPTENGSFAVVITNGTCEETSDCVTITNVGVKTLTINVKLDVYPNPNTGSFVVQTSLEGSYIISNALGQIVKIVDLKANQDNKIKLVDDASGVYMIRSQENPNLMKRFVIHN